MVSTLLYLTCGWNQLVFCLSTHPLNTWGCWPTDFSSCDMVGVSGKQQYDEVGSRRDSSLPAFEMSFLKSTVLVFLRAWTTYWRSCLVPQNASGKLSSWECPFIKNVYSQRVSIHRVSIHRECLFTESVYSHTLFLLVSVLVLCPLSSFKTLIHFASVV